MYDSSEVTRGTKCDICGCNSHAVVDLSGANLCIEHYAEEMGLSPDEAVKYLRFLGISVPVTSLLPFGKAADAAELGM